MTVADSDVIKKIRNTACVVCGQRFSFPRAGKLYCSARCKQFTFYHREEISVLRGFSKGASDCVITLSFKEYEHYRKVVQELKELNTLEGKRRSKYETFTEENSHRYDKLSKQLPNYSKKITPKYLSMEEWAYFKVKYPCLSFEVFFKIVSSVDREVIERLRGDTNYATGKNDIIRKHFESHLLDMAKGKVVFT